MRSTIQRFSRSDLVRSSLLYTVSTVLNSAVPFLLIPVLTRYLTPSDYGIVAMFYVLVGIISPFVGLSIHGAISVRYFDKEEKDLPRYIGNCFLLLLISSAAVSMIVWGFSGPISRLAAFPRGWLWAVLLVSVGQFVIMVLMTLWQVENKPVRYGMYQNSQTLMNIGLSVLLVVGLGKAWEGRIEAHVATVCVFAAFAMGYLYSNRWVKWEYSRPSMDHAWKFGVPLIPHVLGGMLIAQTDRIFITNMVGVADTGIYTVGFQIGYIVELFASSFNRAFVPWLYKRLGEKNIEVDIAIVKYTYVYFAGILAVSICVSLVAPWFLRFFVGEQFTGAYRYVAWVALGFAFSGMYYMVANYLFYAGKTHILAWTTFLVALLNIPFNYILIKMNGAVGAAQASALALLISFLLTWTLSSKAYRMPWNLKRPTGDAIHDR